MQARRRQTPPPCCKAHAGLGRWAGSWLATEALRGQDRGSLTLIQTRWASKTEGGRNWIPLDPFGVATSRTWCAGYERKAMCGSGLPPCGVSCTWSDSLPPLQGPQVTPGRVLEAPRVEAAGDFMEPCCLGEPVTLGNDRSQGPRMGKKGPGACGRTAGQAGSPQTQLQPPPLTATSDRWLQLWEAPFPRL